jgi:hypothetical protein
LKLSPWVFALIISCSLSYGQYSAKDFEDMSQTEKMMMYNSYKKTPILAVGLEIVPTLGYAYANNWSKGLFNYSVGVLCIVIINSVTDGTQQGNVMMLNTLVISAFFDVYKETKKYNNRVYRDIFGKEPPSFSLNLQPTYQGANLTLAYKFD